MNHIGSKRSLLPEISRILDDAAVPSQGLALDLFAGTGAVAQLLKQRGHIVYANDWQQYSYATNVALIEHDDLPSFDRLLSNSRWRMRILWTTNQLGIRAASSESSAGLVIQYLNQLPGYRGAFYEAYCEGGRANRLYFSARNGLRIQAIRDEIEEWAEAELITTSEKAWLVACLIESADSVANTASIYGAYLKQIKPSAQRELSLCLVQPVHSPRAHEHKVFCCDSRDLLERLSETGFQLVYIDPPYNARQ